MSRTAPPATPTGIKKGVCERELRCNRRRASVGGDGRWARVRVTVSVTCDADGLRARAAGGGRRGGGATGRAPGRALNKRGTEVVP